MKSFNIVQCTWKLLTFLNILISVWKNGAYQFQQETIWFPDLLVQIVVSLTTCLVNIAKQSEKVVGQKIH